MNILTATVTKVNIAGIEFEGLLLENGEYAIALQQVAHIFQLLPKSIQKYVNDRLGNDSSFYQKVKTNREEVEGVRSRSAENALSLLQLEKLIRKLDREGNKTAQALSRIDIIQKLAKVMIRNGVKPTEAVKSAINTFGYQPISYKE
jgi:type I site-specific restriction endonuclease